MIGFTKKYRDRIASLEEELRRTRKKVIESDVFYTNRINTLQEDKKRLREEVQHTQAINASLRIQLDK